LNAQRIHAVRDKYKRSLLYLAALLYLLGSGWLVNTFLLPIISDMAYWLRYIAWALIFVPFILILAIAYADRNGGIHGS